MLFLILIVNSVFGITLNCFVVVENNIQFCAIQFLLNRQKYTS